MRAENDAIIINEMTSRCNAGFAPLLKSGLLRRLLWVLLAVLAVLTGVLPKLGHPGVVEGEFVAGDGCGRAVSSLYSSSYRWRGGLPSYT